MRLRGLVAVTLTVAAVLAACESAPTPTPAPAPTPVASMPIVTAPPAPAVTAGPISLPPPSPVSGDTCGADLLQGLVGRPRTTIPVPVDPSKRRVVCTNCPRTQDLRPDRQTIEYNPENGEVTSVSCG